MTIALHQAEKLIRAAETKAKSMSVIVSVCVVDTRGDIVALIRMDKALHLTPDVARGKAMVSAMFGQPSSAFTEQAASPVFQTLNQMNQGRLFFVQGALPIMKDGERIGGIGVSGATAQQDEDIAKAAIEAL
ncbi:MAG: heme-binding protein [Dehalococcoidia bacterium]|nr:heme-binding protein [Dehalococcoidia bacterium]